MSFLKTKKKSNAVQLYTPNQNSNLARRGNTDLAKRGDYSIVPADDYDLDVIDGEVNLYRPQPVRQQDRQPKKPFNLLNSVKALLAWTFVALAVFGFLTFATLHQTSEILLWISGVAASISGYLILAMVFEAMLLGFLSELFGGKKDA